MKKIIFTFLFVLTLANVSAQKYTVSGQNNGHDYVDLGLSVKWATCNIGASSPEDYGNYFAWGEITIKDVYTKDNSITSRKKKFSENVNVGGNPKYDAAVANWGGSWRLPTYEELEELFEKCTWKWTEKNGVKGCRVTGPNGNSIFLPAAGDFQKTKIHEAESYGYYWSSRPSSDYRSYDSAYEISFSSSWEGRGIVSKSIYMDFRENGKTIRPVTE